jgi:NifU-like protein
MPLFPAPRRTLEENMWEYTEKVRDHFLNPRNVGALEDANAVGEVGSLACGDALKLFLKINDAGIIEDASFQTFGCASAIASSLILTELLKGKTIEEAKALTNQDIAASLGGLPKEKMHCSVMGQEAWKWRSPISGREGPRGRARGRARVQVLRRLRGQIRRAIRENHLATVEEITDFTKAGGGCGECRAVCRPSWTRNSARAPAPAPETAAKAAHQHRTRQARDQGHGRGDPAGPQKDGGDIELVDIDGKTVLVALRGSCTGCPVSNVTLTDFVQKRLRELVEPDIAVKEAGK